MSIEKIAKTNNITSDELELKGRKLALYVNKQVKEMKKTHIRENFLQRDFWSTISWMRQRRSMKNWTLKQLIIQNEKAMKEHNITIEFFS